MDHILLSRGRRDYGVLLSLYKDTAAAAKSLQLCPTLCDPIDGSPPGSAVPGILQARVLEWGDIAFSPRTLTIIIFFTSILESLASFYPDVSVLAFLIKY